jgi:hypothetical protein
MRRDLGRFLGATKAKADDHGATIDPGLQTSVVDSLRNAVGARMRIHRLSLFIVVAIFCSSQTSLAQFSQQAELVGSGAINGPGQITVAVSSDGNTALVGGRGDNGTRGAVWVFARSEGVWRQQGAKLVGTGANGATAQGSSIALSSDGNTALVGGPGDGVWAFIRSGGLWTQQGGKLTVSDATGRASLGDSVDRASPSPCRRMATPLLQAVRTTPVQTTPRTLGGRGSSRVAAGVGARAKLPLCNPSDQLEPRF